MTTPTKIDTRSFCIAITKRTQQPCPNKAEWKRGRYCHIHDPYGKNQNQVPKSKIKSSDV